MNRVLRRLNRIDQGDTDEARSRIYPVMHHGEVTSREGEYARFLREIERELLIALIEIGDIEPTIERSIRDRYRTIDSLKRVANDLKFLTV